MTPDEFTRQLTGSEPPAPDDVARIVRSADLDSWTAELLGTTRPRRRTSADLTAPEPADKRDLELSADGMLSGKAAAEPAAVKPAAVKPAAESHRRTGPSNTVRIRERLSTPGVEKLT
jgi:hypothetical protein